MSSANRSTRPPSSTTQPKPPTRLDPSVVIADSAVLIGTHLITIGANTILHPRARIVSTYGPVTIGQGCIISEKVLLGLQEATTRNVSETGNEVAGVVLEDDVVLEPACVVAASHVGCGTRIEAGARVGDGATLGEYCKIAPLCNVAAGEQVADYEVVFGSNQRRRIKPGLEPLRKITHDKEIQVLRRLIPSNLTKWQSVGSGGS